MLQHLVAPLMFGTAAFTLADIFVDAGSANCATGTGTASDPVCTISAAVALASSGDTVRIAAGTYEEHVVLGFDLDLVGTDGAEVTTVDGGGSGGSVVEISPGATVAISGLTLTGGKAPRGGGIFTRGNLTLQNSYVANNEAETVEGATGGGIASFGVGASITILNSTISGNTSLAANQNTGAGGIHIRDGALTIRNSTIEGNEGYYGGAGGGISMSDSTLVMSGSTISNNYGGHDGGGIALIGGSFDITNSTISGNRSTQGAAIASPPPIDPGASRLTNVTITDNFLGLTFSQAAVSFTGPLEIRNSILANNHLIPSLGGFDVHGGGVVSLGNNLIGSASGGLTSATGDLFGTPGAALDALLAPLQDNGGPTFTHAPLSGSPAIDAGHPVTFEAIDQRGLIRPFSNAPDIGAFELESYDSLCSGDGSDQVGCTDCPCSNNAAAGTIGGCLNSSSSSARLSARGDSSVSQPAGSTIDLRFGLSGLPSLAFSVLASGAAVAPGSISNPCFGSNSGAQSTAFDGLRCAIQDFRRHGSRSADALGTVGESNAPWGGEGDPAAGLANAFGGFTAGQTRFFQAVYRDDIAAVCMRGLNSSQAIEVEFRP